MYGQSSWFDKWEVESFSIYYFIINKDESNDAQTYLDFFGSWLDFILMCFLHRGLWIYFAVAFDDCTREWSHSFAGVQKPWFVLIILFWQNHAMTQAQK